MKRLFVTLTAVFLVLAGGTFASLSISRTATAAPSSSQNITLSPSSTDLVIAPGDTIRRNFKVINSGSDSFKADISVTPYHVEGENYDPKFTQLAGTVSPLSWVTVNSAKVTLKPGDSADIDYSVTVPKNASPGGYYLVLFAETNPVKKTSGGVVPHNRVGNILYITVKGAVKNSGTLKPADLKHIAIQSVLPIGVKVGNTGGVHFVSTTTIDVKNITGKKVYHASLERYVLPQTERLVTADWQPSSPVGLYTVSRSATVAGVKKTLPDQWVLHVQPWFFTLFIALIVLIVIYGFTRRIRSSKKLRRK